MSNDLAPKMGSLGAALMDDEQRGAILDPNKGKFLPSFKVVYGIETQNDAALGPYVMKAILRDGDNITALGKGYRFTVLELRPAYRTKKDGNTKSERAFGPVANRPGKSHEKYEELHKRAQAGDKNVEAGASALVAIMTENGTAIASLSMYKSTLSYWSKIIHKAVLLKKGVATIDIADHSANLKKTDSGNSYLDGKKFTQYEIEEVTADDYRAIEAAYKESEEAVKNWLAQ